LEILERGFLDYEKSGENIELLLKNNIEIVVDDFGVGYSGFGML
jgi:sensor c-di-GMP phosphodiesterase-like protein